MEYTQFLGFTREALRYYTPLVSAVLLTSAAATLAAALHLRGCRRCSRVSFSLAALLALELTLLYILLIRYHLGLAEVEFSIPGMGSFTLLIPPWVEEERLLFWLWMYSFMVLYAWRYSPRLGSLLNLGSLCFAAAIYLTGRAEPLPEMRALIEQYLLVKLHPLGLFYATDLLHALQGRYMLYSTWYMWVHPPLVFFAYAAFTVSFFACIAMLVAKEPAYERAASAYAKLGYLPLTVGLLLGYPWAVEAWKDVSWWWSPVVSASFMMWFFYTAYLHARLYLHSMRTLVALLGIAGYASVLLAYAIIFILPGAHSYA